MADHNCLKTDYLNLDDFYQKLTCWKQKTFSAVAAVKPVHEKDKHLDQQIKKLKQRADNGSNRSMSFDKREEKGKKKEDQNH